MKRCALLILLAGMSSTAPAHDTGYNDNMVMGSILGGMIGAVIGNEAGGRDGAILGSAIGAATGTAMASRERYRANYREKVIASPPHNEYYEPRVIYFHGDDHRDRGWHRGYWGHHREHHHYDGDD